MNRSEFERHWGVEVIDGLWCSHCWFAGSKRNHGRGHVRHPVPHAPPGDHWRRVVRTETGARGLLSQPYGFDHDQARRLSVWCDAHGCVWRAVGEGEHHPATVAVFVFPERVPVDWRA